MKNTNNFWPVPESYSNKLPKKEKPGGFWENRIDRFHCGVDVYAPVCSEVFSIKKGEVLDVNVFTNSDMIPYWNKTYYVDILTEKDVVFRYAELEKHDVSKGQKIDKNSRIGFIGQVLNPDKITENSPEYIKKLKNKKNHSMLHLETYKKKSLFNEEEYLGGNWFGKNKPDFLINPSIFFKKKDNFN